MRVVDEVGDGVSMISAGQTVAAPLGQEGGYTEVVCVPESEAVSVPEGVDAPEAVCVVVYDLVG